MEYRASGKGSERWTGDRVKALRRHLGLTQQEMSAELGTRQQTISEWETGLYRPRGASHTVLNIVAERSGFRYDASSPPEAAAPERAEDGPTDEEGLKSVLPDSG